MPLIGYWPLHEDSGSTAYDLRGSNDGTINGATVGSTGVAGTNAYSFNGSGDYVSIPVGLGSFSTITTACWVKLDSTGDNRQAVHMNSSDAQFILGSNAGNWRIWTSQASVSGSSVDTSWHHICGTFDGSTLSLYVDGSFDGSTSLDSLPTDSYNNAIGGDSQNSDHYVDGKIAEVRIYNHALSPSTIQYLYEVVANQGNLVTGRKRL